MNREELELRWRTVEPSLMKPETKAALEHILNLKHQSEEYEGDHWATGNCPRCLAEIALGVRNPNFGGLTLEENRQLVANAEAKKQPPVPEDVLSPEASAEVMRLLLHLADRASVPAYQISLSVEPLEGNRREPFWIVGIGNITEGHPRLDTAFWNAVTIHRRGKLQDR